MQAKKTAAIKKTIVFISHPIGAGGYWKLNNPPQQREEG